MNERDPRIAPGSPRDLGLLNSLIVRVLGIATGGPPPNVFLTLGRHRALFRKWLAFAGGLMPGGGVEAQSPEVGFVVWFIEDAVRSARCFASSA